MKKAFWVLSGFAIAALTLSGCGGASPTSSVAPSSSSSRSESSESTKITYVISFDLNGGTSPSYSGPVTVESFAEDVFFFDCVKDGWNFRGWSYNGTKVFDEKGNRLATPEMSPSMTFVAMYAQTAKMSIVRNMPEAGTVTGEGEYPYNTYVDVSAVAKQGYEFVGWYFEDTLLSNTGDYKYMMWSEDVTLEARFKLASFLLDVHTNNDDYGLVLLKSSYPRDYLPEYQERRDYTTDVTIAAYSKTDVRFLGWYDESNSLVETNAVYNFTMPNHDYVLEAKWNHFNVTYNLNGGTNDPSNPSSFTLESGRITLKNPMREHYNFVGWQFKGEYVHEIDPSCMENVALEAVWEKDGEYWLATKPFLSEDGKTVRYGLYPQKNVNDPSTVEALNKLTAPESNGWYLYNGDYYAKATAKPYESGYKFDNGTAISSGSAYWFRCEPIEWDVLSNDNGEYYVLSSLLLDAHCYYRDTNNRTIDGKTVYPNNYEYSDIREWLNADFYGSAFALGDEDILVTAVDNSAPTTDNSTNPYACGTTNDKVFLPSYKDYLNSKYGFSTSTSSSSTRHCKTTDWARVRGAFSSTSSSCLNNGYYWTRSPRSNYSYDTWRVYSDGSLHSLSVSASYGSVRPGLSITIA